MWNKYTYNFIFNKAVLARSMKQRRVTLVHSLLHQENQSHSLTSAPTKSLTGSEISCNGSKTEHHG